MISIESILKKFGLPDEQIGTFTPTSPVVLNTEERGILKKLEAKDTTVEEEVKKKWNTYKGIEITDLDAEFEGEKAVAIKAITFVRLAAPWVLGLERARSCAPYATAPLRYATGMGDGE